MIVGEFRDGMPQIVLTVTGKGGQEPVEFILDTAFNGDLTLPPTVLQQLGVTPNSRVRNRLASGIEEYAVAATVSIEWLRSPQVVEAIVYRNNPLLGTALLEGCHIDIEAVEGGQVIIEPM